MSSGNKRDTALIEKEHSHKVTSDMSSPQVFPEESPQVRSSTIAGSQDSTFHDATKHPRPKGVLRYQERLRSSSLDIDPTYHGSTSSKLQHHVTFSCESFERDDTDPGHFQSSICVQEDTKCVQTEEKSHHVESSSAQAVLVGAESFDNYETPPSTPTQPLCSKKSFLCAIDEDAPLNLQRNNSFRVRSKSRSPSRDSTSSKDSGSSGDACYEDAKEFFPPKRQNSREVSPPIYDSKEITSPSSGYQHGSIPPSSLGLYQRRRMKRRILRLQSLDEVAAGVVFPDEIDVPAIIEGDQEAESDQTFVEQSPDLPPLSWDGYPGFIDKPYLKTIRRHFSTGDAVIMSSRRPNQLLFPPRPLLVGGVRKSHSYSLFNESLGGANRYALCGTEEAEKITLRHHLAKQPLTSACRVKTSQYNGEPSHRNQNMEAFRNISSWTHIKGYFLGVKS